ncbi:MAG: 2-oxoacid:acceptor oxidoreductase family protein [Candidatus Zixiibacteriota bacterium]
MLTEIRLTGFGGQGIIRFGYLLGKAASIFDEKQATMTQSFGPEARGSACSSQVVVSDDRVLYPYVTTPHIVVAMSQEGFAKHGQNIADQGSLLVDEDLVKPDKIKKGIKFFAIPATRFAEEMKLKIVANIVMFGFFTAVTGVVTEESAKKAIKDSFKEKLVDINLKAFDKGYQYGKNLLSKAVESSECRVKS